MGCSFWTAIFFEWKPSAVSRNFLHEVLATLSGTSHGSAILGNLILADLRVCEAICVPSNCGLLGSTLSLTVSRYFSW